MSDNNNYLRIEGEVLRLGQRAVSIRNICEVSTSVPQAAFPSSVLYLGLAGVVCLLLSGMESTLAVVGLLLVAGAAAAYYSWKQRNASAPKGVSIRLASGNVVRLESEDHALADEVVEALARAMGDPGVSMSIDLRGAVVKDSQVGSVGSVFGNGR